MGTVFGILLILIGLAFAGTALSALRGRAPRAAAAGQSTWLNAVVAVALAVAAFYGAYRLLD